MKKNTNKYADLMLDRISQCIEEETKNLPAVSGAVVSSVNTDGTINVCFPPDYDKIFTNLSNQTPFLLEPGDSVELLLKDGSYNNCWIIAKHQTTFDGSIIAKNLNNNYATMDDLKKVQASLLTEIDPVFISSPAYGITSQDIANWNNASIVQPATTNPVMDGVASIGSKSTYARADHVHPTDTSRAAIASPIFSGVPEAPTAANGTNTDQIATTAFVKNAVDAIPYPVARVNNKTAGVVLNGGDVGAVPTSRTINGIPLSSNITLSASDVEALPATTIVPTRTSQLTNDSGYITSSAIPQEVFVVNYNGTNADKTFAEIRQAWTDKKDCIAFYENSIYFLEYSHTNYVVFSKTGTSGSGNNEQGFVSYLTCTSSDVWSASSLTLSSKTYVDTTKQAAITASGILKGDGFGNIAAAEVGVDYQEPLPSQIDNEGKFLSTDGSDLFWEEIVKNNIVSTTYANLVTLRDEGNLIPGYFYRITDYNFVTTKLNMQSGNHQFDIVLLALSENMLSENAHACKHNGDHYFEREVTEGGIEWIYTMYVDDYGANYGAVPVDHQDDLHASDEFCDSGVLPHPDTGDDVPVLYKTDTGEYSTDEPDYSDAYFYEGVYDFDGDDYDMWSKYEFDGEEWIFKQQYALTPIVVENNELIVSPIPETKIVPVNMNAWELKYCLDNDKDLFDWAETEGKGVIYWLKDEFGNEAPYDFKNAMFRRYQVATVSNTILNELLNNYIVQEGYYAVTKNNNIKYWYTFVDENGTGDGSLFGECTYNIIKPYVYLSPKGKNIRGINNIVLQNANQNNISYNCYNITILRNVKNNNFNECNNICGMSFAYNTLSASCHNLTINGTSRSEYGEGSQNIIGHFVDNCKCGQGCADINFGENNSSEYLDNACRNITFGQWCYSNTLGIGCSNITLGNYCIYNTIAKMCSIITFTNYYRYCEIEEYVSRISLDTSGGNTSNYVQYIKICKGLTNKTITPVRKTTYEQIYYTSGKIENAL